VGYPQVLDVEECQSPPEGLRFMVLLDTKPLTGVNPPQAAFQRMIDLIGAKEIR
jgi:hypothetical protein